MNLFTSHGLGAALEHRPHQSGNCTLVLTGFVIAVTELRTHYHRFTSRLFGQQRNIDVTDGKALSAGIEVCGA